MPRRNWTQAEQELLLRLLKDGDSRPDIASFLNRPLYSVIHKIGRSGWAGKYDYFHHKLRLQDIVAKMVERGYSRRSMAIRLHMTTSGIGRIVRKLERDNSRT